jgi:hypothetical protein
MGERLYRSLVGPLKLASREAVRRLLTESEGNVGDHKFTMQFLQMEWAQVVDVIQRPEAEAPVWTKASFVELP